MVGLKQKFPKKQNKKETLSIVCGRFNKIVLIISGIQ